MEPLETEVRNEDIKRSSRGRTLVKAVVAGAIMYGVGNCHGKNVGAERGFEAGYGEGKKIEAVTHETYHQMMQDSIDMAMSQGYRFTDSADRTFYLVHANLQKDSEEKTMVGVMAKNGVAIGPVRDIDGKEMIGYTTGEKIQEKGREFYNDSKNFFRKMFGKDRK